VAKCEGTERALYGTFLLLDELGGTCESLDALTKQNPIILLTEI
jgi:hypothetical protein